MSVEKEVCMWSSRLRLKWIKLFLKKLVLLAKYTGAKLEFDFSLC